MPHLFDPLTIRGVTLKNRIGMSPMCTYSYQDGYSNDWQLVHLGSRASGGVGLIIAEATAVEPRGRITPDDVGIWCDAHIEPLARVARFITQQGSAAGIQIGHAGRKASVSCPWEGGAPLSPDHPRSWQAAAPSPIPFGDRYPIPHELELPEILNIQAAFRKAAERALAAGFQFLEIHAAHGYLLHNFYSPLFNRRGDMYGGSFENRIRFLMETARCVREVWPDRLPLAVRISGVDWTAGGWTIDESVELARRLKEEGVDLIDCSSGGIVANEIKPYEPGYQAFISDAVRKGAQIPTAAVGLITEPAHADQLIQEGCTDIVLLGRELLRNPYWALRAARELKQEMPVPRQYLRGY